MPVLDASLQPAVNTVVGSSVLVLLITSSYLLTRALLPSLGGRDINRQIAVAVGFAIVWIGFTALGLSYTSWKITFLSLVFSLATVAGLFLVGSRYAEGKAKDQVAPLGAPVARFKKASDYWHNLTRRDRGSVLFLGLCMALSIGLAAVFASSLQEPFVEFFIDSSVFPGKPPWHQVIPQGAEVAIPLTFISHEPEAESFHVLVQADGEFHQDIDLGRIQPDQEKITVATVLMEQEGVHRIDFLLYMDGLDAVYRFLRIWLQVSSE